MLEPIRVGDGVTIPPPEYLPRVREICDRHGILLIFDEVVTGFGRTGKWFASEHWNVVPDIMTLAKGLNSGYAAVGATVVRDHVADFFDTRAIPFGFTNNGQPLAFAAACAVIDALRDDCLVERSAQLGETMLAELKQMKERHPSVGEVRGLGLMAGVELVKNRATREPIVPVLAPRNIPGATPLDPFKKHLIDRGLIAPVGANVLRLYPPLCVTEAELQHGLAIVDEALELTDRLVTSAS
jgi:taurine--2-oxoglutarate transaminase